MPSYVLNPLLDEVFFEDVLCKKFLSLDLREPPKSLLSVMPIGYKKVETPCPLSLGGTSLTDSRDNAPMTSSHWGQHFEQSCPPLSRWNKMSFWAERSVSMVEAGSGDLRWPSGEDGSPSSHCKQPSALSPTISGSGSSSSSSSSSRYKTELCRTFAESGICKYGGKCQFAHGAEELRDLSRHPKYKTEPCRTFHTIGASASPGSPPGRRPRSPPRSTPSSARLRLAPGLGRRPELLSPADPLSAAFDPSPRFQASREPARPFCCHALPRPEGEGCRRQQQQQSMLGSFALGSRSLSYTSLSDHEGGSGSSSSSLSGSETSVFDGASRRLPIFSQLSVPDDGLGNGGSAFFI
ncbi:hypothetical protein ANANG_G00231210 [Anguilla anguilla]|uniref:mRNA decay activator protein ZFP36 n=1 Tax=Anguilla anguilla TaxID=7936 RepID=A0A9D3RNG9_ANGAN|nr:hypothetical protein ANANG_G00231210 [Anguilla anguilla]